MLLLTDWLPRKAILAADQRAALPEVLRAWLRFVLTREGIDPDWIRAVIAAVDTYLPDFGDAFDDETSGAPPYRSSPHSPTAVSTWPTATSSNRPSINSTPKTSPTDSSHKPPVQSALDP